MEQEADNQEFTDRKAERAFRTIAEVSEELKVPAHVLRFWEKKFTEVSPVQRAGGRRYYRPEDISLLKKIEYLLYQEGYTIKGVQKLLKDGTINAVIENRMRAEDNPEAPSVNQPSRDPAETAEDRNERLNRTVLDNMISELEEIGELLKRAI